MTQADYLRKTVSKAGGEYWADYRKQMLAETSRFIEWGLQHPEEVTWIPARPADDDGFPAGVADWYWTTVLSDRLGGALERWRERLRRASGVFRHK